MDGVHVALLPGLQGCVQQHLAETDDGVHRCTYLVAHVGQKGALGLGCLLGMLLGLLQFLQGLATLGDIHDHPVDPLRLAVVGVDGAGAFRYPVQTAIAVPDAVFEAVGPALAYVVVGLGMHIFPVRRVNQLGKAAAGDELAGRPAGQLGHRIADEQHLAPAEGQATKGDAGDVGDQRAVLALAVEQGLLHRLALADIADEADKQRLAVDVHLADGQPHGKLLAVAPQPGDLPAAADDAGLAGAQIVGQIVVVAGVEGLGHQHVDVAPQHLSGRPAEDTFSRRGEQLHPALAVDGDDAVDGGLEDAAQAAFVVPQTAQQVAIAQDAIGDTDHQPQGQHHQADPQRQYGGAIAGAFRWQGVVDHELGGGHAGVMHGGDCQPQAQPAQDQGLQVAEAEPVAQPEAQPDGQHRHTQRQQQ